MKKRLIIMMLLSAMILTSCKEAEEETIELLEPAISTTETVRVEYKTLCTKTMYEGFVAPKVVELSFSENGVFGEYKFQMGDEVKKGDVLAVTYSKDYDDKLQELEKEMEQIDRDLAYDLASADINIELQDEYINQLYDQKYALQPQLKKDIQFQYQYIQVEEEIIRQEGAREKLRLLKTQTQETADLKKKQINEKVKKIKTEQEVNTIVAPCDGKISAEMPYLTGNLVSAGKNIIAISDYTELVVRAEYIDDYYIDGADAIFGIYEGEHIELTPRLYTQQEYDMLLAKWETPVSTFVPTDESTVLVAGDYIPICIANTYVENVLAIPLQAIIDEDDKHYVMVETDSGKEKREIIIGEKDGYYREVASGLKEGEIVYVSE